MSERESDAAIPVDASLDRVLTRLEGLALAPTFAVQRELALSRALRAYLDPRASPISPLPSEVDLAELYVLTDYHPDDGQLPLIEQLRDTITEHIPEDERAWLDPLLHSYMDLLEVMEIGGDGGRRRLDLRSFGDGGRFTVEADGFAEGLVPGQGLLTRLVRLPDRVVLPGAAIVLSPEAARAVHAATDQGRHDLEIETGSFALREWPEFCKRFGYLFLWNFAQTRLLALIQEERSVRFVTAAGEPFLYALALYEHHEFRFLADALGEIEGFEPEPGEDGEHARTFVRRLVVGAGPKSQVVARLTLTPSQAIVECESPERLDDVKHLLASTFGFSLHFRGETTAVPAHKLAIPDLAGGVPESPTVVVSREEERHLLAAFLATVFLEWPDRPSPALGGRTPRHAAASPETRAAVAALIDEIERYDPARRRTGSSGYDYGRLREKVGV